jgi:type III pantothenate kinase
MTTTLCFDFGNSRLKCGVFIEDRFMEEIVLPNDNEETILQLLERFSPQKTILSSVINHNKSIETILKKNTSFHLLSHLSKLAFTTPVGKAETIGADRIALISAAVHFYPKMNNLIISLGSCITYNFVNQYHEFLGGAISPGTDMRLKSMNDFTAKLPLVKKDWNFPLIGYDTKTNLQSGVLAGITYEIEGFIESYQNKFGNFNVVLTGGDCTYFAQRLKNKIFADSNFLFKGLYALSETNNT